MKNILVAVLALNTMWVFGQKKSIPEVLSNPYDFKMISSGRNSPNFNPTRDSLTEIVVLLHSGYKIEQIKDYFGWSDKAIDRKVNVLLAANFIKKDNNLNLVPAVFVTSIDEGNFIRKRLKKLIRQTADSIRRRLPELITQTKTIKSFRDVNFSDVSLLVLSDVLLDNWQISNVENDFLHAARTLHNGKNYYAAYQERLKNSQVEALGVYGNQYSDTLNYNICEYGNRRNSKQAITKTKILKKEFSDFGERSHFNYPVIDSLDDAQLQNIAGKFLPVIRNILDQNKPMLLGAYKNSPYLNEVSFEEYFIWVYHIYYTAVTDELIKQKIISLPKDGVSFYAVLQ
ncbi:MAG TPA: hypothetical protein VFE53_03885 [Mucilaginibacter sp.]|jgi:hypothetical protein|nr:hypothetical protein [Mucilaginibacter sp.]